MSTDHAISLDDETGQLLSGVIVRRRVELGYRSARAFGRASGLDYRTITALEAGRRSQVSRSTLAIIEQALEWPAGYLVNQLRIWGHDEDDQQVVLAFHGKHEASDIEAAQRIAQAAFEAALGQLESHRD